MTTLRSRLALLVASLFIVATTGLPTIVHTCAMDVADVCEPASCCATDDPASDDCADEAEAMSDDGACCEDVIVVNAIHPDATPTASIGLPTLAVADLPTQAIVPDPHVLCDAACVEHRPNDGYGPPPDPARLGVFLI